MPPARMRQTDQPSGTPSAYTATRGVKTSGATAAAEARARSATATALSPGAAAAASWARA